MLAASDEQGRDAKALDAAAHRIDGAERGFADEFVDRRSRQRDAEPAAFRLAERTEAEAREGLACRIDPVRRRHGHLDRAIRTIEVAVGNARGAKGVADRVHGGAQPIGGDVGAGDLQDKARAARKVESGDEAMGGQPAREPGGDACRQEARQDEKKARHEDEPEQESLPAGGLQHRGLG
ncbi:MAG: hypothetical protein BGO06_15985 [Shinella sp. 65-6]|nr:MAG: hypothetical protein BGO06_15985 [Shinella sp. 65-6]